MVYTAPDYSSKWRSDTLNPKIDTSEIARRINPVSSPDGRGRMRWFDDMQGVLTSWTHSNMMGGSYSLTTDYPYTGDQAHRLESSAVAGSRSRMFKALDPGLNPKIGVEVLMAVVANDGVMEVGMSCSNEGYYALGSLKVDIKNDKVWVQPDYLGAWVDLADHNFSQMNIAYMSLKLVGDYSTGKWMRCIVNGVEYDLSSYTWVKHAGDYYYRLGITIEGGNIDAEICKYNVGAVFITDQEP